jgi:SAM-dependent methyltransferase
VRRLALLESIAGAYASEILLEVCRSRMAADLLTPHTGSWLARRHRLNSAGLHRLLDFLALSTDLIRKEHDCYRLNATPASLAVLRYQLEKFRGAYGPAVRKCLDSLRDTNTSRRWVDREALAAAFAAVDDSVNIEALQAIARIPVGCLVDLGCGTGTLLRALALGDRRFTGIGIDADAAMCREARKRIKKAGIEKQVGIVQGQAPAALSKISSRQRDRVEALHAASFLNEFFGQGTARVINVLRDLGRFFPGRRAWFVDYYGQRCALVNVLQDVAQVVSGQGVPPSSRAEWSQIYHAAGCLVVSLRDFRSGQTEWFLHEVVFRP